MFMSKIDKGTPIGGAEGTRYWFNLLGGVDNVEHVVRGLAKARKRFSLIELGTLAGVGVLDQYRAAVAKTDLRWWRHPGLVLAAFYGLLGVGLPLLGFAAGIAIDVAVFGGAAESLMAVSPIYAAFAVGSLIFAVGLAIVPDLYKRSVMIVLTIACLGASMIAADTPAFRAHFANWLPFLKTEEVLHERNLAGLRQQANGIVESIAIQQKQVQPVGRPDMLHDGTPDNDQIARDIYANIAKLNTDLVRAKAAVGIEEARFTQSSKENAAQYFGRIIGGIYIFCWLLASQYVITAVIETAAGRLAEQREQAAAHDFARRFVAEVDSPDRETSKGLIEAAVSDMLIRRFSLILAEEAVGDEKLEVVTLLFEEEPFQTMQEIGVALVCRTLTPRDGHVLNREAEASA